MAYSVPTVLAVVHTSWGAVDWILPVLRALRISGSAEVFLYFRERGALRGAARFADLADIARAELAGVFDPDRLIGAMPLAERWRAAKRLRLAGSHDVAAGRAGWRWVRGTLEPLLGRLPWVGAATDALCLNLLKQRLPNRRVDLLLHDFGQADTNPLREAFPTARALLFPHGTNAWAPDSRLPEHRQRALQAASANAAWLAGAASDEEYYRRQGVTAPVLACGHPKYDPRWIARLRGWSQTRMAPRLGGGGGSRRKTLLFLSRPIAKSTARQRVLAHVESVFRVAGQRGWRVLAKLHPHQQPGEILPAIRRAGRVDYAWVNHSVMAAACAADLAVALPTSAVMDALAVGVPALEFFDYTGQDYMTFVRPTGKPGDEQPGDNKTGDHKAGGGGAATSVYRQQGIVEPVDREADLAALLTEFERHPASLQALAERQRAALARVTPPAEHALERALGFVEEELRSAAPSVSRRRVVSARC